MAMGNYERDQERIKMLWNKLEDEPDNGQLQQDGDENLAFDELETQDHNSDSEEEFEENNFNENVDVDGPPHRIPFSRKSTISILSKYVSSRTIVHTLLH